MVCWPLYAQSCQGLRRDVRHLLRYGLAPRRLSVRMARGWSQLGLSTVVAALYMTRHSTSAHLRFSFYVTFIHAFQKIDCHYQSATLYMYSFPSFQREGKRYLQMQKHTSAKLTRVRQEK